MTGFSVAMAQPVVSDVTECPEHWIVGDIVTAPGERAGAVSFSKGKIQQVGDASLAPNEGACVISLPDGAVALPGLHDAHAHLIGIGFREMRLNLEGTTSIAMLKARLADALMDLPDGQPLTGRGWIETGWPEKRMPNRDDLDAVAEGRIVILGRSDGHAAVVNSAALDAAGIDDETPDPEGGRIVRDRNGRATGLLIDNAQSLVAGLVDKPTREERKEALRRGADVYASRGWTSVHNMSVDAGEIDLMAELGASGELPIRVFNYLVPEALDAQAEKGKTCTDDMRVCVMGIKFYVDGALGSRGALLFAPYSDEPSTMGLQLMTGDEARPMMQKALDAGLQVATHAIGDKGNRIVLDWYWKLLYEPQIADHRWRIEHAQILKVDDIARFAKQAVIASMQPSHAIGDLYFAGDRLGSERLKGAYAWRSLVEQGAIVVGGSDAPVEQGEPAIELHAATRRFALNGYEGPDWHPEEALTEQQALAIFTTKAAYAVFREDELGRLAPGYRADITVLTADPFRSSWEKVDALMTFVDGERHEGRASQQ
ncbi:amidohydrolase [Parvularcula sp. LCG005]|uniref:amidohydrolase n=1 Tax=Parvularcula sp. LCG005 TaxID=3078805 RepID=UPI002941E55A|nr:amidohydrolase [Parvularcula sp. LCG005]WOI53865.1 amidohydrolase [Parvularcula sp. LCG005]